ncbi:MAG: DUF6298 domain-containing protein, partial [Gemmatimonadota bacterium]|nr:DUF6298 domain-containing protein [Gemmatimonadota bacterium]
MRAFLHLTFSAGLISALMILSPGCSRQGKESHEHGGLTLFNGWYVQNGKIIWGYAQHNGWWRKGQRPNLTRNAGDDIRPNRTENLALLADNMLCWGYPGFEHNFGLWYDRRRDAHDTVR